MNLYQVTGNEYLSIPTIRECDACVEGITFLYMAAKGMIELKGDVETPLFRPSVIMDDVPIPLTDIQWERAMYWIPKFSASAGPLRVVGTLLCPIGERGFYYRIEIANPTKETIRCGAALDGCWKQTLHEVNESKPVATQLHLINSNWNHSFVMEARAAFPLFALAPMIDEGVCAKAENSADGGISYRMHKPFELRAGESRAVSFTFGIGYEEVAASTAAKELKRQGYEKLLAQTERWLNARARTMNDAYLRTLCNANMFFSFFFASGRTLDTGELVLMTSRSPRYYVSCAYWDRDSLLWSFPAILMADPAYAREILEYVFTRQIRNVGIHSRFIDGTVLEPGFELDELCAPLLALERYLLATGDEDFFRDPVVQKGIGHILAILELKKHPDTALYETFLMPTDDVSRYPYLTYNNVLVWKVLSDLGRRMCSQALTGQAGKVKRAIEEHCIKERNGKRFYCWSADLNGNYDVYDEPPGSLLLLPYLGFCKENDEVYKTTVARIRDPEYPYSFAGKRIAEIGCAHAPHPWVLSVANSLLSGNVVTAVQHLHRMTMDNGIACESVHEDTGECATGEAFATCAGFLAFAIDYAFRTEKRYH